MKISEAKREAALRNLEKASEANRRRLLERPRTHFNCKRCGIAVLCKPSHLSKKSYCSSRCMAEAYRTRLNGANNPNFKSAGHRVCAGCGIAYESYSNRRKYCSLQCYRSLDIAKEQSRVNGRKNHRAGGRVDANQPEIVDALRQVGASVIITSAQGRGFPDLVIGWRGRNYLLEVKNPNTAYGRQGFNKNQRLFNAEWRGSAPIIVRSVAEALAAIGIEIGAIL